ncbi:MAG: DUF2796 domain-containing protein [Candidatus Accumulibacter sp. UW26]|jgi:hypothetical protein
MQRTCLLLLVLVGLGGCASNPNSFWYEGAVMNYGPGPQHADLDAEFFFHCAQPAALQGLEVKLFSAFPGYRQIRAQVVTGKRQSAARLSPKASTLRW